MWIIHIWDFWFSGTNLKYKDIDGFLYIKHSSRENNETGEIIY